MVLSPCSSHYRGIRVLSAHFITVDPSLASLKAPLKARKWRIRPKIPSPGGEHKQRPERQTGANETVSAFLNGFHSLELSEIRSVQITPIMLI